MSFDKVVILLLLFPCCS